MKAISDGMTKYTPASGTLALKKAICRKFERENGLSYKPENIVVSNGAKHSLVNALGAICEVGDEVIIPAPFWVSYYEMVKLNDGVPVILNTHEENLFKFTPQQLEAAITPKTRAIIINSPSNPTGMVYTKDELCEIAKIAVRHGIYIISDEIYEHLIYEGSHTSIASFGEDIKDLTIIVNGVSKTFAMTGWRIGYTAANAKIAKAMANVQSHATSNPNSIAQAAAGCGTGRRHGMRKRDEKGLFRAPQLYGGAHERHGRRVMQNAPRRVLCDDEHYKAYWQKNGRCSNRWLRRLCYAVFGKEPGGRGALLGLWGRRICALVLCNVYGKH